MNTKTNLAAAFIATILCLLAVLFLSSCAPKIEGEVLGHGWDGTNYYLMIATEGDEGVEGVPLKVTREEYDYYQTGDFYGGSVKPSERTIIGKGADGAGNTWLIVSSCQDCEKERIEVDSLDAYKIGDKLP